MLGAGRFDSLYTYANRNSETRFHYSLPCGRLPFWAIHPYPFSLLPVVGTLPFRCCFSTAVSASWVVAGGSYSFRSEQLCPLPLSSTLALGHEPSTHSSSPFSLFPRALVYPSRAYPISSRRPSSHHAPTHPRRPIPIATPPSPSALSTPHHIESLLQRDSQQPKPTRPRPTPTRPAPRRAAPRRSGTFSFRASRGTTPATPTQATRRDTTRLGDGDWVGTVVDDHHGDGDGEEEHVNHVTRNTTSTAIITPSTTTTTTITSSPVASPLQPHRPARPSRQEATCSYGLPCSLLYPRQRRPLHSSPLPQSPSLRAAGRSLSRPRLSPFDG
jgi:hypothetical protein